MKNNNSIEIKKNTNNNKEKMSFSQKLLAQLLKNKIITKKDADSFAESITNQTKNRIDYFLLDQGIIEKKDLLKALSSIYKVPAFDVKGYFFNHELLLLFPKEFLLNNKLIPLSLDDEIITIIMSNPEKEELCELIENYASYSININVGIERDIIDAINEYYDEDLITEEIQLEYNDGESNDEDDTDDSDIVDYF